MEDLRRAEERVAEAEKRLRSAEMQLRELAANEKMLRDALSKAECHIQHQNEIISQYETQISILHQEISNLKLVNLDCYSIGFIRTISGHKQLGKRITSPRVSYLRVSKLKSTEFEARKAVSVQLVRLTNFLKNSSYSHFLRLLYDLNVVNSANSNSDFCPDNCVKI